MNVNIRRGYDHYSVKIFKDVEPGMIYVDVGAAIGMTMLSMLRSYPYTIAIGIEPLPMNFKILEEMFLKRNNVFLFNKGCWASRKESKLYMNPASTEGSSIHKMKHHTGEVIDVQLDTLDNMLESINIDHVDLLKIDCENSEPQTLAGFRKYKDGTQFHIECHDWNLHQVLHELFKMNVKELNIGVEAIRASIYGTFGSPPGVFVPIKIVNNREENINIKDRVKRLEKRVSSRIHLKGQQVAPGLFISISGDKENE